MSDTFRIGFSGENLGAKDLAHFSPKIYRAGASYLLNGGRASLNFDLRQREINQGLGASEALLVQDFGTTSSKPDYPYERMAILSGSATVYDMFLLSIGWGRNLGGFKREQISAGLGLANDKATLSFSLAKPQGSSKKWSQAVSASLVAQM